MTKQEYIERYGIEWYEAKKAKTKACMKERYINNAKYREAHKARMNVRSITYNKVRYVKDGRIDLIENYNKAKADNFKGWEIHHRLELHPDCSLRFTYKSLIKLELYYNRPPTELIWLTKLEHRRMHTLSRQ